MSDLYRPPPERITLADDPEILGVDTATMVYTETLGSARWQLRQAAFLPWGLALMVASVAGLIGLPLAASAPAAALLSPALGASLAAGLGMLFLDRLWLCPISLRLEGSQLHVRAGLGRLPLPRRRRLPLSALSLHARQEGHIQGMTFYTLWLTDDVALRGLICSLDELRALLKALGEAQARDAARHGRGQAEIPAPLRDALRDHT